MAGKKKSWEQTKLWKQLEKRAASRKPIHEAAKEIIDTVRQTLKKAEAVLSKAHTAPLDFTLHDEQHSFRVAERMLELVPANQVLHLSDYEIALLLLAAYLHDIGMTPERKKVSAVHDYLLTKGSGLLSEEEVKHLQCWLDENRHTDELPLRPSTPVTAHLHRADFLTAFYARHQHNEWSAEWMRQHLDGGFHFLTDWKETLILLCQSHHFDHAVLRTGCFDPRPVNGPHPQRVCLRHLACILRIADILENDPERVPVIVFQHRDIGAKPESILHWHVPHDMTLLIEKGRVCIHALPRSARAEKAVRSLADAIDYELTGCQSIYEQQGFSHCPGMPDLKREWLLQAASTRDIQPRDGGYVYIEGAFRPRTEKLLQLLAGTQLYDTPLAAIRELLQNAFDAVREKIARRRLQQPNAADEKSAVQLGALESVTLSLRQHPDGTLRLQCRDTGSGMTRSIIENHLLVSGDGHRPAIIDLERRCQNAGFTIGRTGQFGIGVLSYFMLAKEVRITTCRLQDCGDLDAPGWTFVTHGVGDFGELQKLPHSPQQGPGTEIEWTLAPAAFPDLQAAAKQIEDYLRDTLIRIPCAFRFEVENEKSPDRKIDFAPGWTHSNEDIKRIVTGHWTAPERLQFDDAVVRNAEERAEQEAYLRCYTSWYEEARRTLRLVEETVVLPEGMGMARIVMPWFELREGFSLIYPCFDRENDGRTYTDNVFLHASNVSKTGWRGMAAVASIKEPGFFVRDALGEVNASKIGWISWDLCALPTDKLQVNRASLLISSNLVAECQRAAHDVLVRMASTKLNDGTQPPFYGAFAEVQLSCVPAMHDGIACPITQNGKLHFKPVRLPAMLITPEWEMTSEYQWKGEPLSKIQGLVPGLNQHPNKLFQPLKGRVMAGLPWHAEGFDLQAPILVWTKDEESLMPMSLFRFPPVWRDVIGFKIYYKLWGWNEAHWLFQLFALNKAAARLRHIVNGGLDLKIQHAPTKPSECVEFLIALTSISLPSHLAEFVKNRSELLHDLFEICAKELNQPVESLSIIFFDNIKPLKLTSGGLLGHDAKHSEFHSLLPRVTDPEWLLEATNKPIEMQNATLI